MRTTAPRSLSGARITAGSTAALRHPQQRNPAVTPGGRRPTVGAASASPRQPMPRQAVRHDRQRGDDRAPDHVRIPVPLSGLSGSPVSMHLRWDGSRRTSHHSGQGGMMTATAWCASCSDATEHEPHPTMPLSLTCGVCGTTRTDRRAQRAAGRGWVEQPAQVSGNQTHEVDHREWCSDPTVRTSTVRFGRPAPVSRVRCLGCGASQENAR